MERLYKIRLALVYVLLTVTAGVSGFMIIERWGFLDSLYMTIITLATVGFSEIHPLSPYGRVFVIALILSGIGVATYFVSLMTSFVVEGEFRNLLRRRKMEEIIMELDNHYIVCGSGKIAREAVNEMKKKSRKIVLIDEKCDNENEVEVIDKNLIRIKGDPTEDKILEMAKIRKAQAILVATDNDANNLYITLTARQINPNLYIVSHAEKESSIEKFRKAGANRVISIIGLGAKRMASSILRPSVVDFLEVAMYGEDFQLQMEEFEVEERSFLENRKLKDSEIRQKSGAIVLAIRREHKLVINPDIDYTIEKSDKLIVLGSFEQLKKMATLVRTH